MAQDMTKEYENMSRDELMELAGGDADPNMSRDELISFIKERKGGTGAI